MEFFSAKYDLEKGGEAGIFEKMEDAVDAAYEAEKVYSRYPNKKKSAIIKAFKEVLEKHVEELSRMTYEETGMGIYEDKILKNKLAIEKTPGMEDLKAGTRVGDSSVVMYEMIPFGVIASIAPSTNPTETIINNSISMLTAGNTVVFSPHPGAKKVSAYTVQLINKAIVKAGGPENLIVTVKEPSVEKTKVLLSNEKIAMICITGGPSIVKIGLSSGKKTVGAGAGNPPVLVDETADIKQAAKDIIDGAAFDNNIACISEKEVIVVDKVADELIRHMKENNAMEITDKNVIEKLEKSLVTASGSVNKKYVGKSPAYIMKDIGIKIDPKVRLIFVETNAEHLFAQTELMMPVIPVIRVKDVETGMEIAKNLEHGNRHTAVMHSKNVDNLRKFEKMIGTTIFVKNAPSYASIGYNAQGITTFTIAGPTGEGLTSARTFTRKRTLVLVENRDK